MQEIGVRNVLDINESDRYFFDEERVLMTDGTKLLFIVLLVV